MAVRKIFTGSASRTPLLYATLAGLWILTFDLLSDMLAMHRMQFIALHSVLAISTVLFLYWLLHRYLQARDQAETQLRVNEAALRAGEKLIAVAEMSAMISHEFRNALTSVRLILELQLESQQLDPSEKKSLAVALSSVSHMEEVVSQLLSFARPSPLAFHLENLNALVEKCLTFVNMQMLKEQIQVKCVFDPVLPPITLDAKQFKEALINLLLNAIHAIASKGATNKTRKISVATKQHILAKTLYDRTFQRMDGADHGEPLNVRERELVLPSGTLCVLIKISDSGHGIEPALLRRIFEPFFTTKTSGAGLGLVMVKRTVNAHNGIVTVNSKIGKGTSFRIYLPLQNQERNHAPNENPDRR